MKIVYRLAELHNHTTFQAEFIDEAIKQIKDLKCSREQLEMIWDVIDALYDIKQSEALRTSSDIPCICRVWMPQVRTYTQQPL